MPNTGHDHDRLQVAVGVIRNAQHEFLIARRPEDKHHGGCWEFPGGKIHRDEPVMAALARELHEELNLESVAARPLIRIEHDYEDIQVSLHVFLVYDWQGEIHGRENQELRWVNRTNLASYTYPQANVHILKALQLPDLYFITPESQIHYSSFLDDCRAVLDSGCSLLQFRCKQKTFAEVEHVFGKLLQMCNENGARLLLNNTPEVALRSGAHGCHLSSENLKQYSPMSLPDDFLLGASCHNRSELKLATDSGMDFAVTGPVQATDSHPDAMLLGWEGFRELVETTCLPVYAIGGMSPASLRQSWDNGARGVAGISGLWNDGRGIKIDFGLQQQMVSV